VNGLTDYRFATREESLREYSRFNHPIPLERALPLVRPGQFAVGHLECTPTVRDQLTGFRVVFAFRDPRDAVVSWLRFHRDTGRDKRLNRIWEKNPDPRDQLVLFLHEMGESFCETCSWLRPWLTERGAFPVRFETLHGDDGAEAQARLVCELAAFLGHANPPEAHASVIPGLTSTPTLTSSGSRTKRAAYWSTEAEVLFASFGGAELTAAFGYE
jgi:hypothetical protein